MSRNSRNVESAKNHISEFSPNSPFSSKLTFSRAPLPSHLSWKLYFAEFSPYLLFSSNWPLSSKSLLWTAPPCHIIWLVHITMANFAIFTVFAKFAIFVKIANLKGDPWSFLISLVPKALANFRLIRLFVKIAPFQLFLSPASGSAYTAVYQLNLYRFTENSYSVLCLLSAKSFLQKLTHCPGKVLETKLKCFEACKNGLFLSCSGYMSGILFSQFDSFQTRWIFYPWSWLQRRKFEIKLG